LWGEGPSADLFLDTVREAGGESDLVMRQKLAALYCESEVLRLNRLRTLSARLAGKNPGPEASIQKAMADDHGQHVMELAKEWVGPSGMLEGSGPSGKISGLAQAGPTQVSSWAGQYPDVDPVWHYGFVFSPALTLGGGTFAVQRNIIAEMVLGLPRDINVERGKTWAAARHPTTQTPQNDLR
ncbi:MAG: acyl-CoA dehydrogenase, partial [Acidimicrobiales bacterium]|nr:acyl-CoA dehydrogenase [Acidimicrobiales bacterium]